MANEEQHSFPDSSLNSTEGCSSNIDENKITQELLIILKMVECILKNLCQQKEFPLQEDGRLSFCAENGTPSVHNILHLIAMIKNIISSINVCLSKDINACIPNTSTLQNQDASNKFLYSVIGNLTDVDWKHFIRILGLSDLEIENIKQKYMLDVKEQKYQMLQAIKQKNGQNISESKIKEALNILKLTDVLSCTETGSHVSAPAALGSSRGKTS
ncbi:uncharacterized protein LOC114651818 isoform X1 [Erpetoichthys calabaricus]|uniref:uncharacterized protein LOC114651818 isoform X1 n=1 Tax=Erpetoichthys calabaricus TaxID=27687 RepID=UPI00109F6828|nr:uncharacterized protein LOC114651818 isoform X1 [Erpetoichthys calabaricus]